ncbi:unnamed protein product [Linum tenue]|uniref:AB hydrolase-1 domain-containing protein n=1 Tax=Linum tenue TaxID=586396 RepID=A0AAV0KAJ9_9ROSI|nr:unnamed protein product [Linum tenue]
MDSKLDLLLRSFTFYISSILSIIRYFLTSFSRFKQIPSAFTVSDACISLYFRLLGLSPVSIHVDDETTLHFWATAGRGGRDRKPDDERPNLVMIHGKCGDSRWQFMYQVGHLSRRFDLYIPDLLFFGKSYTTRKERSEAFQAKCLAEGLRKLGVDKFSIYGISYGGYVGYHLAHMSPDRVEKVVLMSTGVGCNDDQKDEMVAQLGRDPKELLVPRTSDDLRELMYKSVYKSNYMKLIPDSFLQDYLNDVGSVHRKEKMELVDHLLAKNFDAGRSLPVLTQDTLLIWGNKDYVFPMNLAYQLQRHLGSKARVAIVKDAGHAVNMDAPDQVNRLIISFILG